jgi:predicted phosphodiesterase
MRVALISDIHGNLAGLKAVLAQIEKIGGVDGLYALGDLVGMGAATDEILDMLIEHRAHLIRGNWEVLLFDIGSHVHKTTDSAAARQAAEWTYAHLSSASRDQLQGLPIQETIEIGQHHKLFLCHAAPNDPWIWSCEPKTPAATLREVYGALDADVIAYGHYHCHHVLPLDGKLLLNVASVGLRRDGLSALTIVDVTGQLSIRQFQVPYDTDAERQLARGWMGRSRRTFRRHLQ